MKIITYGKEIDLQGFTITKYSNNDALCILAILDYGYGEIDNLPISVNLNHGQLVESQELKENEFALKNYSENEEIVKQLIKKGLISITGQTIKSGFVNIPVAKLTCDGEKMVII